MDGGTVGRGTGNGSFSGAHHAPVVGGRPDLEDRLASGEITFDRLEAVSRIPEAVGLLEWADITGVRREAAKRAQISAGVEARTAADRFLVMQPSLDESWWKLWGGLDGYSGALVDKVLAEAADQLPAVDGLSTDSSWKRATALVDCLGSDDPPPAQLTVVVDAKHAASSDGQAGVVLEPGSRVGRETLNAILCDTVVEVTARTEQGRYMGYGRRQRTTPPALKRALLAEVGFTCAADGCTSARRLQIHHLTPWSQGGETNQNELVVLLLVPPSSRGARTRFSGRASSRPETHSIPAIPSWPPGAARGQIAQTTSRVSPSMTSSSTTPTTTALIAPQSRPKI